MTDDLEAIPTREELRDTVLPCPAACRYRSLMPITENHEGSNRMRDVYPVKYYKDEGFVERKIEIDDEDLDRIIAEYLSRHADFDFDEIELVMIASTLGSRQDVFCE